MFDATAMALRAGVGAPSCIAAAAEGEACWHRDALLSRIFGSLAGGAVLRIGMAAAEALGICRTSPRCSSTAAAITPSSRRPGGPPRRQHRQPRRQQQPRRRVSPAVRRGPAAARRSSEAAASPLPRDLRARAHPPPAPRPPIGFRASRFQAFMLRAWLELGVLLAEARPRRAPPRPRRRGPRAPPRALRSAARPPPPRPAARRARPRKKLG